MIIDADEKNTLPSIEFDEKGGIIIMKGRSIANCPEKFYSDFIVYLKNYLLKHSKNLEVTMDIEYFNTRSAGPLLNFFKTCQIVIDKGFELKINWFIEEGDISMQDAAEDYASILKIPFNVIEKTE